MSDGFTPISSSCEAKVFLTCQTPALLFWPSGIDAIASPRPVSHNSQALRVLDQIAGARERAGTGIARRKAPHVGERDVAAVEHVHPLDPRLWRLRRRRPDRS